MTNAKFSTPLGHDGREILQHGTPLFPCATYSRDIHQFIAGEIIPHWHQEVEIFLLDEGRVHITLMDQAFDLRSGEGYFINSNILHGILCRSDTPCRYRSIVFDPAIVSGPPGSAFDLLYVRPFLEQGAPVWLFQSGSPYDVSVLTGHFNAAYQACEEKPAGYEFFVRDALSHILLLLREPHQPLSRKPENQQEVRMKQMLSWLDAHFGEPITIARLAGVANICVRECQRSFSNLLHSSPMQYVARRRVSAAAELLISTDLPILEIGLRCGLENPSYFTKQFKEITGMTPSEYRKRIAQ